jgi:glucose/arabinose dehydrogenase
MVLASRPARGEANVLPDSFIACDVDLPNAGKVVDGATLSPQSLKLYRTVDRLPVPAVILTSGGGDDLVLRPMRPLELNTQYTFEVTPAVKDTGGNAFQSYRAVFSTAPTAKYCEYPVAFQRAAQPLTAGHPYTCVTIGPDHRLYASSLTGEILSFAIAPDGTLGDPFEIDAINLQNGGDRLITGIAFDPASTAEHLLLWVNHGQLPADGSRRGLLSIEGASDWTGKVSLLSGPSLSNCRDVIVRLPRAWKDHLNNQMAFGPDGAMYFCQASNTAMGAPDHKWGFRPEHLMSSAILRLDTRAARALEHPLDVKTEDDGRYDPFAPGAPLTIYATGIRNSFDLVWHSNGHLYAATNGSAAGGNVPATPTDLELERRLPRIDAGLRGPYDGPAAPALWRVNQTEDDDLFDVRQGAYYGHPNPTRAEYVLNGANPDGGESPSAESNRVPAYPPGTLPDRNYRPPILSFGKNLSPCGGIEYQSDAFHGQLRHKLMFVRYSGGGDVIAVAVNPRGAATETITGIEGLSHFINPVDLCEDPANGRLYVAEIGARRITLLRPKSGGLSHHVCRADNPIHDLEKDRPVATSHEP